MHNMNIYVAWKLTKALGMRVEYLTCYRFGTGGGAPRFGSGGGAPLGGGGAGGGAAPLLGNILPDGVPGVVVDEEEVLSFSPA